MDVYIENAGVYGPIADVEKENALKVYVYEDNNRIVANVEFFYNSVIIFDSKKGSSYMCRFYNPSSTNKLVNILHPKMIAQHHLDGLYDGEKGSAHMKKGQMLASKVGASLRELRRSTAFDYMNNSTLQGALKRFQYFQWGEMLCVVALTIAQVQLIKKMFKTESIL